MASSQHSDHLSRLRGRRRRTPVSRISMRDLAQHQPETSARAAVGPTDFLANLRVGEPICARSFLERTRAVEPRDASVGFWHWGKWWLRGTLGTMAVAAIITLVGPRAGDDEKGLAWYDEASMSAFAAMCPGMALGVWLGAITYRRGLKQIR